MLLSSSKFLSASAGRHSISRIGWRSNASQRFCFSGTIFKTKALPAVPPHITVLTDKPVRQFISAGTAGQEVPARSLFTPSFIKAIRGEADLNKDKFVTGTELGMYLHEKVTDYSDGMQTPQYGKIRDPSLDEGDTVFGLGQELASLPGEGTTIPEPVRPPKGPVDELLTGTLVVRSPESGRVSIDGGQTYPIAPDRQKRWDDLAVGHHTIKVTSGDSVWEEAVVVREGQTTTAEAVFGPKPGKELAVDLGGGVNLELVWVEALKGWVGKYEVTNEEYRRFKLDHDSQSYDGKSLNGSRQPSVNVSYDDAVAFCEWVNRLAHLPQGYTARLPDGNEWMTFAQCGDNREYPWGNDWPPKYGNYSGQEGAWSYKIDGYNDGQPVTCDVERSGKNDWGLYGVGGNVWEWTGELSGGSSRVLRGAAWLYRTQGDLRCDGRLDAHPSDRINYIGFRVVVLR